jgi:hypothetical protein
MKKTLLSGSMAILVLIVLTSLAFAAPVATPFTGTLTGSETQQVVFPYAYISGQASGTATHLGLYTLSYTGQLFLPTLSAPNATQTFVAANGDMLFAEGAGQGQLSSSPGLVTIEEWYTITGGTGRFEGATGSYTVYRTVVRATLETWGYFEGSLVNPNGK